MIGKNVSQSFNPEKHQKIIREKKDNTFFSLVLLLLELAEKEKFFIQEKDALFLLDMAVYFFISKDKESSQLFSEILKSLEKNEVKKAYKIASLLYEQYSYELNILTHFKKESENKGFHFYKDENPRSKSFMICKDLIDLDNYLKFDLDKQIIEKKANGKEVKELSDEEMLAINFLLERYYFYLPEIKQIGSFFSLPYLYQVDDHFFFSRSEKPNENLLAKTLTDKIKLMFPYSYSHKEKHLNSFIFNCFTLSIFYFLFFIKGFLISFFLGGMLNFEMLDKWQGSCIIVMILTQILSSLLFSTLFINIMLGKDFSFKNTMVISFYLNFLSIFVFSSKYYYANLQQYEKAIITENIFFDKEFYEIKDDKDQEKIIKFIKGDKSAAVPLDYNNTLQFIETDCREKQKYFDLKVLGFKKIACTHKMNAATNFIFEAK